MGPVEQSARVAVVTPGNYDGVHLGHRALVSSARQVAAQGGASLRVVALTFDPHPLHFMASDRAPPLLTTVERRIALLRDAGADEVVVQRFDRPFALLTPEGFVEEVLVGKLAARAVVVGSDFRFGAKRAGDVALLEVLGGKHGFSVTTVAPVKLEGELVSSSQVRAALLRGDVATPARMLTRVHDLERLVVKGDQRGRTIGFPTANLQLEGLLAPADGVYAVSVRILDGDSTLPAGRMMGVANLGVRPTVSGGRSMEVHILDFAGDIYGRTLRIGFVERLRGEVKFPDLSALKAQIARDVESGRRALEACDPQLLAWI
jgi:riboflavin kinase/FMN adenylyltransferase